MIAPHKHIQPIVEARLRKRIANINTAVQHMKAASEQFEGRD